MRLWHGGDPARWPLAHLRLWTAAARRQQDYATLAATGPAAQNRAVLDMGLRRIGESAPKAEDLLRQRFEHLRDVDNLASSFNIAEQTVLYRQRQAVHQLQEALIHLEKAAGHDWRETMYSRLELAHYGRLVGVEKPRELLYEALLADDAGFLVAVTGLGGIGKTALVDQVTRDLIETTRFEEIAWITAKQTHLSSLGRLEVESGRPALTFPMLVEALAAQLEPGEKTALTQLQRQQWVQRYLRQAPCLVVVDNLETAADYRTLLPELRKWQTPSKFLLTSRVRLIDQPDLFELPLEELPAAAAYALIRQEAARANFGQLAGAETAELHQIYTAVGGNPLALKLIIGQLRFQSLPEVLARLTSGGDESRDGIFDYIYRESWEHLDDAGKQTLLALVQAGESGITFGHIQRLAGLAGDRLLATLEELVLLSLVEVGGNLNERRYRLHRLTELFLLRTFS